MAKTKITLSAPQKKLYKCIIGAVYMNNSQQSYEHPRYRVENILGEDVISVIKKIKLENKADLKEFVQEIVCISKVDK